MKKIAFLSIGQWASGSELRSAADMLRQSIHLAVAAEEHDADGAYFRVHHFARQLASPHPLLAAIGAKTSRIEIGTAVIDMRYNPPGLLPLAPQSPGLLERIWGGTGSYTSGAWAAQLGMNLRQSATVEDDRSGAPLHVQQRRQIDSYRTIWRQTGHRRDPRVSVFRTVNVLGGLRSLFGAEGVGGDYVTTIGRTRLVFGRSYAADPDTLVKQLSRATAIEAADTLMLTIDNGLGVDHSIRLTRSVLTEIAPALGWR